MQNKDKQVFIVVDEQQRYAVAYVWDNEQGVQQMEIAETLFAQDERNARRECADLGIRPTHSNILSYV